MNHRFYAENQPLIQPMYNQLPDNEDAYQLRNQYFFGSELIVSPITSPSDPNTKLGKVKTLLPEGIWYDMFTGLRYRGGRTMYMFRSLDTIPALAKAGGIVPLQSEEELSSRTDNPVMLDLLVFCGADGEFTMYEDDGISMAFEEGYSVRTRFCLEWSGQKRLTIDAARGDLSLIPAQRRYTVKFYGIPADGVRSVLAGGVSIPLNSAFDEGRNILSVYLSEVPSNERVEILLREDVTLAGNNILGPAYDLLNRAQIAFLTKERLYRLLKTEGSITQKLSVIYSTYMDEGIREAITELLTADVN